jgi:hypothetical protein
LFYVANLTSGAFTVTVKTPSGTGIVIPSAGRTMLECDATNVAQALSNTAGSLTIGSATPTGLSAGDIGFPNSGAIRWRNAANSAYLNAMYVDASNNLIIGGSAVNVVQLSVAGIGTVLTADSLGNLGLGFAPNVWYSSVKAFEMPQIAIMSGTGGGGQIYGNGYLDASAGERYKVSGLGATKYNNQNGSHAFLTASPGTAGGAITFTQSLAFGKGLTVALEGATSAAGTGIAFPATQVASSDANTIDDYEEGAFTPTISGTTTAGAGTYTAQTGRYTKIGNRVHFSIYLVWTAHTGTGSLLVTGLPFTSNATALAFSTASVYAANLALTAGNYIQSYIAPNNNFFSFDQVPTGGGAAASISMDTSATILLSGTYEV